MTAEPVVFDLPETMKVEECHALDQFIRGTPDCTIYLCGRHVKKFSGLGAQTAAAHNHMRQQDGQAIRIIDPSDTLINALAMLGLSDLLLYDRNPE